MSHGNVSVSAAREWLKIRALDKGANCPVCDRFTKVYKRQINKGMAMSLAAMYRKAEISWIHLPTEIPARSREEGKLAYWGLVEEQKVVRGDGGRAGWWRVTKAGEEYLLGRRLVPRYALVYNGRCFAHDGELVGIERALGRGFDLQELMAS